MLPFLIGAAALTAIAAHKDHRTGLIPNWLTFAGIALGCAGHFVYGALTEGLRAGVYAAATSVAGLALCAAVPALMFVKGAMGGGDVKLFAALGALCHPMLGLEAQMYAFLVVAVTVPAKLAYEGRLFAVLRASLAVALSPLLPRARRRALASDGGGWVRIGPAICAGTLITLVLHGVLTSLP